MTDDDEIECSLPFARLPQCICDKGSGEPPTKLQMMHCKIGGGPCSARYRQHESDKADDAR